MPVWKLRPTTPGQLFLLLWARRTTENLLETHLFSAEGAISVVTEAALSVLPHLVAAYERLDAAKKKEVLLRHRRTFNEIEEMRLAIAADILAGTSSDAIRSEIPGYENIFDFLTAGDIKTIVRTLEPKVVYLMALENRRRLIKLPSRAEIAHDGSP